MNIQTKLNYFGRALRLKQSLFEDTYDGHSNLSANHESVCNIPAELSPLCLKKIDERKLTAFQLQKTHALRIAKEFDFDVRIEASGTQGYIEFITDNILINEFCDTTIRNWFLNMLRRADDLWLTITEKYDQNVISLTFFFDLSRSHQHSNPKP